MMMVKVRDVRMRVSDLPVGMSMTVPTNECVGMRMILMVDVIRMVVFVLMSHDFVLVGVLVTRSQRQGNTSGRKRNCDQLNGRYRLAQKSPRDDCADERRGRKEHLTTSSTEIPGAFDPQRDGEPVSECSNDECRHDLTSSDVNV